MGKEYVRRWLGAIVLLVSISAAAVAEEVEPHFNAEVLGLTEDGSHIRVRLHEPDDPDRRVKSLRGYFVYRDRDGQVLVDRPLTARSVGPYPFYRESPRIFEDRMPEGDTRLRRMAQEHPERIAVSLVTTNLEFDDSLASHPRRTISTTRSDEQVRLDYDVREGEAVLFALVTRRWERTWVNPRSGLAFSGDAVDAGMKLSVRVTPPQANDNGAWKLEFGHVDASAWAGSVASIPPDDDEMDVQVHSLELPLLLGDAEAHLIPYRVVGDRTDSVLIIFAKEPAKIKDVVRLMPGREDFDWDRGFFHVRPFAEGHPQDDNDGHVDDGNHVTITGRLHIARDGKTEPASEIRAQIWNRETNRPIVTFETDEAGRFAGHTSLITKDGDDDRELEIRPWLNLWPSNRGVLLGTLEFVIPAGEHRMQVEGAFQESDVVQIAGIVRPAADTNIDYENSTITAAIRFRGDIQSRGGFPIDGDGRFSIPVPVVPGAEVRLSLNAPGLRFGHGSGRTPYFSVTGRNEPVELPVRSLRIDVVVHVEWRQMPDDLDVPPGAHVVLRRKDDGHVEHLSMIEADGRAEFAFVPDGKYGIEIVWRNRYRDLIDVRIEGDHSVTLPNDEGGPRILQIPATLIRRDRANQAQ